MLRRIHEMSSHVGVAAQRRPIASQKGSTRVGSRDFPPETQRRVCSQREDQCSQPTVPSGGGAFAGNRESRRMGYPATDILRIPSADQ